jgi:hypothetical protein
MCLFFIKIKTIKYYVCNYLCFNRCLFFLCYSCRAGRQNQSINQKKYRYKLSNLGWAKQRAAHHILIGL